ncbi:hypothetical protein KUCAC02_036479 [Chaenocephalus aceratus]|nr:hypothetical protein KUCAC02_036479 [Chaenocephalus aceratus]
MGKGLYSFQRRDGIRLSDDSVTKPPVGAQTPLRTGDKRSCCLRLSYPLISSLSMPPLLHAKVLIFYDLKLCILSVLHFDIPSAQCLILNWKTDDKRAGLFLLLDPRSFSSLPLSDTMA